MIANIHCRKLQRWLPLAMILAGAALLYLHLAWALPLSDRDEGEYGAVSLAMLDQGEWIVPTLNGRNYLEKPILTFWLVIGSFKIFGVNEFAVRFPSAASVFLLLAAFAWLTLRTTRSIRLATWATGFLAFMPMTVALGKICLTDGPLVLFTTIASLCFFLGLESDIAVPTGASERRGLRGLAGRLWRPSLGWHLLFWLALGLGFMVKGPVAPAVTVPGIFVYLLLQRRLASTVAGSLASLPIGLLVFLAVTLPWYGAVYARLGDEFIDGFFRAQFMRRGLSGLLGHSWGPWYYLAVLLGGAFPFVAAAVPGCCQALLGNPAATRQGLRRRRLALFCALQVVLIVLVFSLSATKLPHYIAPALPFLALLAAIFLSEKMAGIRQFQVDWLLPVLALVPALAAAAAALAAPVMVPLFWEKIRLGGKPDSSEYALPAEPPTLWFWCVALAVWLLVPVVLCWRGQWWPRNPRRLATAMMAFACGLGLIGTHLFAGFLAVAQEPFRGMVVEFRGWLDTQCGENIELGTYGLWKPSLHFYFRDNVERYRYNFEGHRVVVEDMVGDTATNAAIFITRANLARLLENIPGCGVLTESGGYALVGNPPANELWLRTRKPPRIAEPDTDGK